MLVVQQELAIYGIGIYVLMLGLDDEHPHFLRTAIGAGYVTKLDIFELSMSINSLQFMQIRDFSKFI